jgi:hypothetical protein
VTINSDNTLTDDGTLKFAMTANEVWYFEALIDIATTTNATFKIAFTFPSGATINWVFHPEDAANDLGSTEGSATSGTSQEVGTGGGFAHLLPIRGIIRNSSNAGDLQFQWAQQTSHSDSTTVKADSWLMAAKEA